MPAKKAAKKAQSGKPKAQRKRAYTDQERAAALVVVDFCEGNLSEASRRTGIPRITLFEWNSGRVNSDVSEIRQEKKKDLADKLEDLAEKYVDSMTSTAGSATSRDAVALGIVIDKMQILRGQPSVINQTAPGDPVQRGQRLRELTSKLQLVK